MMLARLGSLLVTLLVLTTALAGCHGLDDDEGGATPTPTATGDPNATASPSPTPTATLPPPPPRPDVTVTITDSPKKVDRGSSITINVTVDGDSVNASFAGIAYSSNSTDPIPRENLTTDDFNGTQEGNGNVTFPGDYSVVNWTVEEEVKVLFIRAYIIVEDTLFWSEEVLVAVNEPEEEIPVEDASKVTIDTRPAQFPCELANFQGKGGGAIAPERHVITVGEAVVWVSQETAEGCVHTATANDGTFDTGDIKNGETSKVIVFRSTGTFAYKCTYHPDTMKGEIKVDPKPPGP